MVARRTNDTGEIEMTAYKYRLRRKRNKLSAQKKKDKERAAKKAAGRK